MIMACVAASACGGAKTASAPTVGRPQPVAAVPVASRPKRPRAAPRRPPLVRERAVVFVDHSRTVKLPGIGRRPRRLVTIVRYPIRGRRPLPLIVFGHGFAVTPAPYSALLQAWARAGYVVAAPIFPLENANAPGGPDESDLVNQPGDMSFVITSMLAASAANSGFLHGMIDPSRIAVAGQSDGGETALAVAYDRYFQDRRVGAAVILSGAKLPGIGGFSFPAPSPPLLATQGTADTTNRPRFTKAFFDAAPPPKYLLRLIGAGHLGPYTNEQPQLGIVARVGIAFFNAYLKGRSGALGRMIAEGNVQGVSTLTP